MTTRATDILLAIRARALLTAVCTTGAIALSATATGYVRAAGSFLDDGFDVGMELVGSGFDVSANNAEHTITNVDALTIDCDGCAIDAEDVGRALAVGLPAQLAVALDGFTPTVGRPYVREEHVPATSTLRGMTQGGIGEDTGLYVLKLFGPIGAGDGALSKLADAVLAQFPKGLALPLTTGDALHVRADIGPTRGQIRRMDDGWGMAIVTVPYRLLTV